MSSYTEIGTGRAFDPTPDTTRHLRPTRRARRPLWILAASLLLAALWGASSVGAQGEEPSSLFIDRVDVNIINVEVFVTDRDDQPVEGLTIEDFEILEDGSPVEITNFYAVSRPDRATGSFEEDRRMVTEPAEPSTGPSPKAETVPLDRRLSMAVYVDNYQIRPSNRAKVLKDLGAFVEDRLRQGDRIALLSHGLTVRSVVPFTDDLTALGRGIAEIAEEAAYGQAVEAAKRRVKRSIEYSVGGAGAAGADPSRAADEIRNFVQQRRQEVERSMKALDGVVRSMSGLPGRKAVLYVSDGVPQKPGAELYQYYLDRFGSPGAGSGGGSFQPVSAMLRDDLSSLYDGVTREANAGQVTLYTLHAAGAVGRPSVSAENTPGALTTRGDGLADAVGLDNTQEPLLELAAATGGLSIVNTSNFAGAFERLSGDFDNLYSLGYPSRRGGDDRFHKIEVRVKDRPKLKVRHRKGYVDKPEAARVADRTYSSLILDLESNPLGITVEFGTPEKAGRGKFHLPMLVRIPFDGITLLPNDAAHEGRLRIHLAVQDEEGGVSDLQEIPYPVSVPGEQIAETRGKEMGYAGKLLVRKGVPKVAIGVWDEISGLESFVHKSVLVGKQKKR